MASQKDAHVSFRNEHMENFDNESSAMHRKLQSKNEALKIMRCELERYRTERDQFKLMAETIQMRYTAIKNSLEKSESETGFDVGSSTLGFLLNQTREKNMALQTEVETLRQKLQELQGDIKILRMKNVETTKQLKTRFSKENDTKDDEQHKMWNEEKSKFIVQLESLKKKNAQLQFDFRSLLDEKEEIVMERDAFKCKAHRLNHELSVVLKGSTSLDIDSLILENKFLQEQITNLESELEHSRKANEKYQSMLDTKKVKGILKLGSNASNQMIISHKQVKKLLSEGTISEIPLNASTISDLKSLCLALLDNLNDKTIALGHQKKTNRLLAAKIGAMEHKIRSLSGDESKTSLLSPSELLLNGYTSAKVDEDLRCAILNRDILSKNPVYGESSESNKSLMSSEYETQSTSDISSELRQLNYIKIISDNDINDDEVGPAPEELANEEFTELEELPPEIKKLVEEAMRNSIN